MPKSKLEPAALRAYLDAGHNQAEAARRFAVSEAAIHQRLKRLGQPTSRAIRAEVQAGEQPTQADTHLEELRRVIEGRLVWATDVARRNGADLVDTVHRLAAEIRRDLALYLAVSPGSGPDTLGTMDGNRS